MRAQFTIPDSERKEYLPLIMRAYIVESQEKELGGWGGKEREEDGKAGALAENAFDLNSPMMGFGDPFTD